MAKNSMRAAKYAMVFMVKGLSRKWKGTLGYFLFEKSINPNVLQKMILDNIRISASCGLYPKFIVLSGFK